MGCRVLSVLVALCLVGQFQFLGCRLSISRFAGVGGLFGALVACSSVETIPCMSLPQLYSSEFRRYSRFRRNNFLCISSKIDRITVRASICLDTVLRAFAAFEESTVPTVQKIPARLLCCVVLCCAFIRRVFWGSVYTLLSE